MNACLAWWGISVAVMDYTALGSSLVSRATLTKAVPVFVAIMVWLIRILIIGTFSLAGECLFSMDTRPVSYSYSQATRSSSTAHSSVATHRPKPRPASAISATQRSEPSYHPIGMSARGNDSNGNVRR